MWKIRCWLVHSIYNYWQNGRIDLCLSPYLVIPSTLVPENSINTIKWCKYSRIPLIYTPQARDNFKCLHYGWFQRLNTAFGTTTEAYLGLGCSFKIHLKDTPILIGHIYNYMWHLASAPDTQGWSEWRRRGWRERRRERLVSTACACTKQRWNSTAAVLSLVMIVHVINIHIVDSNHITSSWSFRLAWLEQDDRFLPSLLEDTNDKLHRKLHIDPWT